MFSRELLNWNQLFMLPTLASLSWTKANEQGLELCSSEAGLELKSWIIMTRRTGTAKKWI